MCLILDANEYGEYLKPDMQPIRDWVKKRGKIAYSPTKKFRDEWEKGGMREMFKEYSRNGKLKEIDAQAVEKKERELKLKGKSKGKGKGKGKDFLESNDPHIIALALVGNVKLLVSADKALGKDFRKHVNKGKIYKKKSHAHLLTRRTCP